MKLPLHNRTAIQKIIAITAAICVISFGLCFATAVAAVSSTRWLGLFNVLFSIRTPTVIFSFAATLMLFAWDHSRRTKRK